MTCLDAPWRWQHHPDLASTQDAAIAAAQSGEPGRLAILADRQSAGRGTRGRGWMAPAGNLNLSLLLRPGRVVQAPGRWALQAGLAVHQALAPHGENLLLKWPNDVLLDGGKLAGILIDSQMGQGPGADWLVVGIGANLAEAPEISGRRTAHLPPPAPGARRVAEDIVHHWGIWDAADIADVREAWMARAHPVGTLLDVQTRGARLSGAFAGLAPGGGLLLGDRAEPICSAEVALW